eukprot:GEMP01054096.1.p1 GENE.GEMP01054096.1~~GEMP01054096.1.p1  ORF type:complete len:259 (+),score=31.57 GEMP01054096.1:174-950(+)
MKCISMLDDANYCVILDVEMGEDYLRIDVEVLGEARRPTDSMLLTRNPSRSFPCRKSKVTYQFGQGVKVSLFFDKMVFQRVHQDIAFEYNPGYSRVSIRHFCPVPEEDWPVFFEQVSSQNDGMARVLKRRVDELTTLQDLVVKHGWAYETFELLEQADVLIVAGALRFIPYDADPAGLNIALRRGAQLLESRHESVALTAAEQLLRLLESDGGFNNNAWRVIHGVTKRCSSSVRQTSLTGPQLSQLCKVLCKKTEKFK